MNRPQLRATNQCIGKQKLNSLCLLTEKDADDGKSTVTEATGHLKVIVDCAQNGKREIEENVTKRRLEFDNLLDKHNEAKKLRLENGETMRKDAEKDSKNQQLAINTNLNVQFSAYESLEKLVSIRSLHVQSASN